MAKQHLVGLKSYALQALVDQGVLVRPLDKSLHESVLPWLIDKMSGFLNDDDFIAINADQVVVDAFERSNSLHAKALARERQRKDDIVYSAEQKIIRKELERQARREAREQRRKQEEYDKLRLEIKKGFIDRGEIKDGMTSQDLLDVNGSYEKNKNFAGTLGGQLMQILFAF